MNPVPDPLPLPAAIRSRQVDNGNGLSMHVLEAGFEAGGRPVVLLLHGFPELAFSWRHQLTALAAAGFHVVAPDQRGYGRTKGWDDAYDTDLRPFSMPALVRDVVGLLSALRQRSVVAVIGHDFGSIVAGWCALLRPDLVRSVVLMSAPFTGPAPLAFGAPDAAAPSVSQVLDDLATLVPPRKHYQRYYGTRAAGGDLRHPPQGLHAFLRAYYHLKSADAAGVRPHPLPGPTAAALASLPTYYVMHADLDMAATVAPGLPDASSIARCAWLPDTALRVYTDEYARTGFQGGLNWYRAALDAGFAREQQLFSGRTIDLPSLYVAGREDWGVYQSPGAFERMRDDFCTGLRGVELIDGAGHWVQQERADDVSTLLKHFLIGVRSLR